MPRRLEMITYDGEQFPVSDMIHSELEQRLVPIPYVQRIFGSSEVATSEWLEDHGYVLAAAGNAAGCYLAPDEYRYCEDLCDNVYINDAHSSRDGTYYFDTDNIPQSADAEIQSYHSTEFSDLSEGSQFKIGVEIEKDNFLGKSERGDSVPYAKVFAGYETDSSCGVEAITNILPLGRPESEAESKVFAMLEAAAAIINSPINENCGGHMTFSVNGMHDGYEVLDKIKPYLAIVYAMYRHRLKVRYCASNKKGKRHNNTKYSPLNVKGDRVEVRLFSAIKNVSQLKLRYRLMYKILEHGVNLESRFEDFLKDVTPLLHEIYKGQENKVKSTIRYSRAFRHYLMDAFAHKSIAEFV